jgi:hypothetical protein
MHGIRQLETRYPWASAVEKKVFLQGFDLAEVYRHGTLHISDSAFEELGDSEYSPYKSSPKQ